MNSYNNNTAYSIYKNSRRPAKKKIVIDLNKSRAKRLNDLKTKINVFLFFSITSLSVIFGVFFFLIGQAEINSLTTKIYNSEMKLNTYKNINKKSNNFNKKKFENDIDENIKVKLAKDDKSEIF
ncbi:MAG: hypothetical protein FWC41_10160 [Firmicutes bacterium]|nr:hypothetical protein [Bacillota bacterium]